MRTSPTAAARRRHPNAGQASWSPAPGWDRPNRSRTYRRVRDEAWFVELMGRVHRLTAGLTVAAIAERTGCQDDAVRRWLRKGPPSAEFLKGLCEGFGVSADWLLLGKGRGPRNTRHTHDGR